MGGTSSDSLRFPCRKTKRFGLFLVLVSMRVLNHLARIVEGFPANMAGVDSLCFVVVGVSLDVLLVAVLAVEASVTLAAVEHAHSIVNLYVCLHRGEDDKYHTMYMYMYT